ncbi:hypothetical protein PIB30_065677 [Stylosanthes scabra]|uniref:Uncharacterized protein n=1 Tax=Stylosanthes scabra TaxID=79078 RepID=A0ABU6YMM0_9FABA|nr:hypothetical protein [Stylosanthes scabra]
MDAPFVATLSSRLPLHFYPTFEVVLGCSNGAVEPRMHVLSSESREAKPNFYASQGIDSNPSESTFLGATSMLDVSKSHESTLKGSTVDSYLDRNEFGFKTLQGVDSE